MASDHWRDQILQVATSAINKSQKTEHENKLLREAFDELESQRNELYRQLARAQMALASTGKLEPDSSKILSVSCESRAGSGVGDSWLLKGWLSTNRTRKDLGLIEDLWKKQRHMDALKELEKLLALENIESDIRINAKLLRSCILRDKGQLTQALTQANEALDIAKTYDTLYDLRGKARFHLGMCQFEAGKFTEALWSFSLASHTEGHADEIEVWKRYAQQELAKQVLKRASAVA